MQEGQFAQRVKSVDRKKVKVFRRKTSALFMNSPD
jgi:hypothetical protein